ncbi:sugar ABC transporter permease [bacterium]|nr:MAG: sugar ABC transporter permease [bacterium]
MAEKWRRFWRINGAGLAFLSPWIVGFLALQVWPFIGSAYLSLTSYDVVSAPRWVGVENYRTLISDDPTFWASLWVTLRYAIVAVPLNVAAGVALALLLNAEVKGQAIFRTLFYIPSILPQVATAVLFGWLLNPELGLVNGILRLVGIEGPAWLSDKAWAPWTLVALAIWGVGGSMVIYLAGLKDVPTHLYEAAILDGAGPLARLRSVTLPMLSPVIFFNVVMGVIGSFQAFTEAYVMTKGGPEGSTTFYSLYLFQRAWGTLDMGYACAMAWVLFVVIAATTALVFRGQKRWVNFER